MTTRFEDGVDVLGQDYEEDVLAIEKAFQSERVTKSKVDEIVERSLAEVETENKSYIELVKTIENYDKPTLLTLLRTLGDEGEVSEDTLSRVLNKMLNAMTDRSTNNPPSVDKNKMEDCDMKDEDKEKKKGSKAKEEKSEVVATETVNTPNVPEVETGVSQEKLVNLVEGLVSKLDEINSRITSLETRPANVESNTPVVPEVKSEVVENEPIWKNVVSNLNAMLAEAVTKPSAERRELFQNALSATGQTLMELHNSLDVQEKSVTGEESSVVRNEVAQLKDQVSANNAKLDMLMQQLQNLATTQQNAQVGKSTVQVKPPVTPPVDRSITVKQPVFPTGNTPNANGMKILDIARKSALGK